MPAKYLPPNPPSMSGQPANWSPISGSNDGELRWLERLPRRWEFSQIPFAYQKAIEILSEVGISICNSNDLLDEMGIPFLDSAIWFWRDPSGEWWTLAVPKRGNLVEDGSGNLVERWLLESRLKPGPDGDFSYVPDKLLGAWEWSLRSADPATNSELIQLINDLAGKVRSAATLEWAFWLLHMLKKNQDFNVESRAGIGEVGELTFVREWRALENAVRTRDDPLLTSALKEVRNFLACGGSDARRGAFIQGFEFGQGLGEYSVVGAVIAGEKVRNANTGKKPALQEKLMAIVRAEACKGKCELYKLAGVLQAQLRTQTPDGQELLDLGLPSSVSAIQSRLKKAAAAAGIYEA